MTIGDSHFNLSGVSSDVMGWFFSMFKVGVRIVDGKFYLSGGSNADLHNLHYLLSYLGGTL